MTDHLAIPNEGLQCNTHNFIRSEHVQFIKSLFYCIFTSSLAIHREKERVQYSRACHSFIATEYKKNGNINSFLHFIKSRKKREFCVNLSFFYIPFLCTIGVWNVVKFILLFSIFGITCSIIVGGWGRFLVECALFRGISILFESNIRLPMNDALFVLRIPRNDAQKL